MPKIKSITPLSLYLITREIEQGELARGTGLPVHRIQRICAGKAQLRYEERKAICEALRQPESVLFGPDPLPIPGDITEDHLRRLIPELMTDSDFVWLLWRLALKVQGRIGSQLKAGAQGGI